MSTSEGVISADSLGSNVHIHRRHLFSGLSEKTIMKHLNTRILSHAYEDKRNCSICQQNEFVKNDEIGMVDCRHEFHVDCIKKWLLRKNKCPNCRSKGLAVCWVFEKEQVYKIIRKAVRQGFNAICCLRSFD